MVVIAASAILFSNTTKYEAYSRFGFSFEYPEGMDIQEQGMGGIGIATITSGIVQGTLVKNMVPDIIGAIWIG